MSDHQDVRACYTHDKTTCPNWLTYEQRVPVAWYSINNLGQSHPYMKVNHNHSQCTCNFVCDPYSFDHSERCKSHIEYFVALVDAPEAEINTVEALQNEDAKRWEERRLLKSAGVNPPTEVISTDEDGD
jgi:hypothetical protein